jgi:hypothetical protein
VFGEVRERMTSEKISKIWCEFLTDLLFLSMVLALLQSSAYDQKSSKPVTCGIPLVKWLDVFFVAFGVKSLGNLLRIYVIQ